MGNSVTLIEFQTLTINIKSLVQDLINGEDSDWEVPINLGRTFKLKREGYISLL